MTISVRDRDSVDRCDCLEGLPEDDDDEAPAFLEDISDLGVSDNMMYDIE